MDQNIVSGLARLADTKCKETEALFGVYDADMNIAEAMKEIEAKRQAEIVKETAKLVLDFQNVANTQLKMLAKTHNEYVALAEIQAGLAKTLVKAMHYGAVTGNYWPAMLAAGASKNGCPNNLEKIPKDWADPYESQGLVIVTPEPMPEVPSIATTN